ncbi:MAG: hypothetical protein RBT41_05705 [Clostridia bacterium]|jgi:UDP-N-acetylmuramyl pentapeptide phosphotransferase/UDP-N-acetylglucosamine-1-phosphate transferase|nr:hypothetical protein [Clostridia bacterium]
MNTYGRYIILFALSCLTAQIAFPPFFRILAVRQGLKKNWRGEEIPALAGIIFPLLITLDTLIYGLSENLTERIYILILAIALIAGVGLYDDLYGDNGPKGLKGHLLYFWRRRIVTTGLIKLIGTGVIAAFTVFSLGYTLFDWLLLMLTVNTVNLLDLRPGRAVKGSALLLTAALLLAKEDYWLMVTAGGLLTAYARYDLQAEVMLGDCGSNCLGMIAGLSLLSASFTVKISLIIVLAFFHALAEKYSFSAIITRSSFLDRLDKWGQR